MQVFEQKDRFATAEKVRSISFSTNGTDGMGALSPRAFRTVSVYAILVRWGFSGVIAPLGAIADAISRCSLGHGGSVRTLQRAHNELIDHGFITIRSYLHGPSSKSCEIRFNLDAFSYWTAPKPIPTLSHNVVSRETMYDTTLPTAECRPKRDTVSLTPQDPTKIENKPRAGARAFNKSSTRRKNEVLFSIQCVLAKAGNVHPRDRRQAAARAKCEISAGTAGFELVNPSGVDWDYWSKRWSDIWPIEARESIANREIVPLLLTRDSFEQPITPPTHQSGPTSNPTAADIRDVRRALEASFSIPNKPVLEEAPPETSVLSGDDLSILLAARARVNGG